MKIKFLLGILLTFLITGIKAQNVDQHIGRLLNEHDWFTLDEEYPKLKNQIESKMLKEYAEAMLGLYFNQPEAALAKIDTLLQYHQQELGFETSSSLVVLKSKILGEQGLYAQSADNIDDFLRQITSFLSKENFTAQIALSTYYNEIRNVPQPEIIRPEKNTEIPIKIEKAVDGTLLYIPVVINGKEYYFIFDTGAGTSFVSERFAKEIGLQIVQDSLSIRSVESVVGKSGTIENMLIGDIVFKNPLIAIAPPNITLDTIFQVDAVLGMDFMRRIGEIQIFPKLGKILFPIHPTPLPQTGRNLLIDDMQPYLKAYSDNERMVFHFDTGNSEADLYNTYYQKHKKEIEEQGERDTIRSAGVGGVRYTPGYRLPFITLKVGDSRFDLSNIKVTTADVIAFKKQEEGSLGMNFFTMFNKVTINFNTMFVEVE